MPHLNAASDETVCNDEVKVYKDEGEEEEQQKSSENLKEDKLGLVIEGEGQSRIKFDLNEKNVNSRELPL
ncbi:T-cell specific, HMG-box [Cichlidogyrus casuarinus]|uniref:T-cell specific, HMG-box n=1 Tax=Cichlidogyrus casuarinus TaxID=1844966 RepID=A0ABD2Q6E3_9PLAT